MSCPSNERSKEFLVPRLGPSWLVPGGAQWLWGQRERGVQLAGAYFSMMSVGLLAWGTSLGLLMMILAFSVHVVSMGDALRQSAFPGFGRAVPVVSSTAGLGLVVYGPAFLTASVLAWPGISPESGNGYLVNRVYYKGQPPGRGEHVWIGPSRDKDRPPIGKVLGFEGEEVEWSRGRLTVGSHGPTQFMLAPDAGLSHVSYDIPPGHLLVSYSSSENPKEPWGLIEASEVKGRAWGQLYPFWGRRGLP